MATENLFDALHASLKNYLNSAKYSDLIIRCEGREFKVHKIILCGQSKYFSTICDGDWKEAAENVIDLKEDDARVIEAMLHFFYRFNYDDSGDDQGPVSPMLFNTRVYGVADKYDVSSLKTLAKEKFDKAIKTCWDMDDFTHVITETYSSTPSADRGLRNLVAKVARKHIKALLERKEFRCVLEETISFAADVTQLLAEGGGNSALKRHSPWILRFHYKIPQHAAAAVAGIPVYVTKPEARTPTATQAVHTTIVITTTLASSRAGTTIEALTQGTRVVTALSQVAGLGGPKVSGMISIPVLWGGAVSGRMRHRTVLNLHHPTTFNIRGHRAALKLYRQTALKLYRQTALKLYHRTVLGLSQTVPSSSSQTISPNGSQTAPSSSSQVAVTLHMRAWTQGVTDDHNSAETASEASRPEGSRSETTARNGQREGNGKVVVVNENSAATASTSSDQGAKPKGKPVETALLSGAQTNVPKPSRLVTSQEVGSRAPTALLNFAQAAAAKADLAGTRPRGAQEQAVATQASSADPAPRSPIHTAPSSSSLFKTGPPASESRYTAATGSDSPYSESQSASDAEKAGTRHARRKRYCCGCTIM
ncbi:MAG: hypothetical protein M1839_000599 [Geoglossum umbratile]|nr:MAG: hypothetical protein M1839_000599 [Geoglossum umbratile]